MKKHLLIVVTMLSIFISSARAVTAEQLYATIDANAYSTHTLFGLAHALSS